MSRIKRELEDWMEEQAIEEREEAIAEGLVLSDEDRYWDLMHDELERKMQEVLFGKEPPSDDPVKRVPRKKGEKRRDLKIRF
jgi:hypothetical protein